MVYEVGYDVRETGFPDQPPIKEERKGSILSRKVRAVCVACNNGWMSVIENNVKPILSDLMYLKPRTLSVEDQRKIAEWVVLKMFVVEYMKPRMPVSKRETLDAFYGDARILPDNLHIDLFGYQSGNWTCRLVRQAFWAGAEKPPSIGPDVNDVMRNTRLFVLGIGRLIIHATHSYVVRVQLGDNPIYARRVWPENEASLQWPVDKLLDTGTADKLAYAFNAYVRSTNGALPEL